MLTPAQYRLTRGISSHVPVAVAFNVPLAMRRGRCSRIDHACGPNVRSSVDAQALLVDTWAVVHDAATVGRCSGVGLVVTVSLFAERISAGIVWCWKGGERVQATVRSVRRRGCGCERCPTTCRQTGSGVRPIHDGRTDCDVVASTPPNRLRPRPTCHFRRGRGVTGSRRACRSQCSDLVGGRLLGACSCRGYAVVPVAVIASETESGIGGGRHAAGLHDGVTDVMLLPIVSAETCG